MPIREVRDAKEYYQTHPKEKPKGFDHAAKVLEENADYESFMEAVHETGVYKKGDWKKANELVKRIDLKLLNDIHPKMVTVLASEAANLLDKDDPGVIYKVKLLEAIADSGAKIEVDEVEVAAILEAAKGKGIDSTIAKVRAAFQKTPK